MASGDGADFEAIVAAEMAAEQAAKGRRARRARMFWATLAGVGMLGAVACGGWALWADGERGHTLSLVGRADQAVHVEIEGERSADIPARGGLSFSPSAPGPRRFRFTDERGHTFERVYDVPAKQSLDDTRLAIPTEEDRCYAVLDINAWYGEAASIPEILRARAEADERRRAGLPSEASVTVPRPRLAARVRALDPLPHGYTRNLYIRPTIGPDTNALSLVDVSCVELGLDDDALVDRALERHAGELQE